MRLKPVVLFAGMAITGSVCFTACTSPEPGSAPKVDKNGVPIQTHCPKKISAKVYPSLSGGVIFRIDQTAMNQLIAPDATIEVLAGPGTRYSMITGTSHTLSEGFKWSEGPVWVEYGRYLLFSDIPPNRVYKWNEHEGLSLFLEKSGYTGAKPRLGRTVNGSTDEPGSNGLLIDQQGRLVLCQHGNRQIARLGISLRNPKPIYESLAAKFKGKRLNSPNDGCYNSLGDLYFTDPPYGLEKRMKDPAKELDFQGVYLLTREHLQSKGKGRLILLTDKIPFPNGIALSPDEKTLYVAESSRNTKIHAFNVKDDGTIDDGRVFFDPSPLKRAGKRGGCDGLKIDHLGNLFATGPGGVLVITSEGKHLGTIETGQRTANCAWGDDGCTLYITADMYLCRIRTKTKGVGF